MPLQNIDKKWIVVSVILPLLAGLGNAYGVIAFYTSMSKPTPIGFVVTKFFTGILNPVLIGLVIGYVIYLFSRKKIQFSNAALKAISIMSVLQVIMVIVMIIGIG